jgi:hypothetical protein
MNMHQKKKAKRSSKNINITIIKNTRRHILHNRIMQKKEEMHRTHNRFDTDHVWTEIETLQYIWAQILTR